MNGTVCSVSGTTKGEQVRACAYMNMHEAGTLAFVIPVVNHGFQLMEPSHVSADNLTPQTNSMLRNDLSRWWPGAVDCEQLSNIYSVQHHTANLFGAMYTSAKMGTSEKFKRHCHQ